MREQKVLAQSQTFRSFVGSSSYDFSKTQNLAGIRSATYSSNINQKLYDEGMKKLKELQDTAETRDYSKLDKRYTFNPEISR